MRQDLTRILSWVPMNARVLDLGCGDGEFLALLSRERGARCIGIDIDPQRIEDAKQKALKNRVDEQLEFYQQDLFLSNFANADVIFIYLLPHLNLRLRPQLWKQLKPGTRIISRDFDMGDWKPLQQLTLTVEEEEEQEEVNLYYWEIGRR